MGHDPLLISAVGADPEGATIHATMRQWGMRTDGLQTHSRTATGAVKVRLEEGEACYEICAPRAWDAIADAGHVGSGYLYHGVLALRDTVSRRAFEALVERSSATRFFDVNLRPPDDNIELVQRWMQGVDWLKLNLDELAVLLGCHALAFADAPAALQVLRDRYSIAQVLLTAGSEGALLVGESGEAVAVLRQCRRSWWIPWGRGMRSAYTLHALLRGQAHDQILGAACRFAASVCAIRGATSAKQAFYDAFQLKIDGPRASGLPAR